MTQKEITERKEERDVKGIISAGATAIVLHPLFWKTELFYLSTVNGMSSFNNVTEELMLDYKTNIRSIINI